MPAAADLFLPDPDRKQSFLSDKWNPMIWSLVGFASVCVANWGLRKPVFAGIQQHILFASLGGLGAVYYDKKRAEYLAERDAVLRHYIELHPEDFEMPERKKFADVLESWVPIR